MMLTTIKFSGVFYVFFYYIGLIFTFKASLNNLISGAQLIIQNNVTIKLLQII